MRFGLKSAALTWGVPLFVEAAALLRAMVLAWGIGAEDLGRAMVLALTLRLAEMVLDIGVERWLAVSPQRDEADFMAALHGGALIKGLATALLVAALAWPMAMGFADGASMASYTALAAAPLMRGFLHLDYRRIEAARQFTPMAVVEGGAAVAMLLALPVVVVIFGDARAMVGLIWVQALAQVVLSHVMARQAYRLRFDAAVLGQLWRFGAPLIINAALMFLAVQADRFIVAGYYGWAQVAAYGIAFQLASLPAQIAGRAAASNLTAALAGPTGQAVLNRALKGYALLGLCFALCFALCAPFAIGLMFGTDMRPPALLALGLGLAAGLRIARTPLSLRAVALGRTGDAARANLWRVAALLPAIAAAVAGLPLASIAFAAAFGEAAAFWRARQLLAQQNQSSCIHLQKVA